MQESEQGLQTDEQSIDGEILVTNQSNQPTGVTILAVLHLIGGILLFVMQFALIANMADAATALQTIGMSPYLLIAGVMFLSVITIGSGAGMIVGAKWGWWLGAFYYVYSIFRNGSAILGVISLADQIEDGTRGVNHYLFKHGARIVVNALLLLYFFKENVLEYFNLSSVSKVKAVCLMVGICVAIGVVTTAIQMALN